MKKNSFPYNLLLLGIFSLAMPGVGLASFADTAIDWALFNEPTGYTIPYTFNGQPVSDQESSSDSTNGGAAVSPSEIDLASGSPDGANPGPYDTPSYGYYNGGTVYDPNDPLSYQDDVIRFTMRVVGDPRKGSGFGNYHWNVLLDVDGDGYKEFWIDLFGKYSANGYDQLQVLYDNANSQALPDTPDKMPELRIDEFRAYNSTDAGNYSHTRVRAADDGTDDWFIDIQLPMTAFTDRVGNQVLLPTSPVGFVFSTSASGTNPLQKDFMTDLGFLTENDPISFGDLVKSNGDASLYFADGALNERDYYTVGDNIVLYLRDAFANASAALVDTITVTVTNPATGDDETVTLTESGPNTSIFSNLGGAGKPVSSDGNNAWIPYVATSEVTVSENWTVTYNAGTGSWAVVGSVSGLQSSTVTPGQQYVSDNGQIRFTLYDVNPVNGATITFSSYAGDTLSTSATPGTDDDGNLQVFGGEIITYSHTQTKTNGDTNTFTDTAQIVGIGEPFIQFTRANGLPSGNFQLTTATGTSDKLYVTVYNEASNTNPSVAETISVTLTGDANNPAETQTLTLVETGPNTGVFRNATGLNTKVSDGSIAPNDGVWEDIDQGKVTATFSYNGINYDTTATLFYTIDAGRVNFTNGAGSIGVEKYAAGQPMFIQVADASVTCGGALSVTVTSSTGDSETALMYETAPGSGVYMNRINDLATTAGLAVVSSASAVFATDGLAPGDLFVIATGPDEGAYTIASVDSNSQLTLTKTLTATRTGIGYMSPLLTTDTYDGAYSAGDGILEANHNDALTVAYEDCKDGDADPDNNFKTDSAFYNAPPIVINEVLFHPDNITDTGATDQAQFEYIQLYNASTQPVSVTGYTVTDGDGFSYTIPEFSLGIDLMLQPGQRIYVVLVPDSGVPPIPPGYDSANDAYYVYAQVQSLPPVRGDTLSTNGTAQITDAAATFLTDGVMKDDAFVIATGPDAGNYIVDSVDSETQITLTQALTSTTTGISYYAQYPPGTFPVDQLSDPDNGINLATTAGSPTVTSATATFFTDGVTSGDPFVIANGPDAGSYVVASVVNQTTLTLTQALTKTSTGLHYTVGGSEDQVSLYNANGTIVDYVAWSASASTTTDFKSDDGAAISAGIWTDNSFKNIDGSNAAGVNGLITPGEAIYRAVDGKDTNQPGDWVYLAPSINMDFVLTLAVVKELRRYPDGGIPIVEWTTISEVGTFGYHLYRREDGANSWTKVSSDLLPAMPPSHFGAIHRFRDLGGAIDRDQWYLLEEVDVRGRRNTYGPYLVLAAPDGMGPHMTADYTREPREQIVLPAQPVIRAMAAATPMSISSGTALRLSVAARGLYFVSAATIAEGLDSVSSSTDAMDEILAGGYSLRRRQQEVAYLPAPESGGLFFVAEAPDSPYSATTAYWLTAGAGRIMAKGGVRRSGNPATSVDINNNGHIDMTDALYVLQKAAGMRLDARPNSGPTAASAGQTFASTITLEENLIDAVDVLSDPDQDIWYWSYFLAGTGNPHTQEFSIPVAAPDTASFNKLFIELSVTSAINTLNTIEVRINNTTVGTLSWQGETGREQTLQMSVDASVLNSSASNTLSITAYADPGKGFSAWYLNRMRITFPREFIADNDSLYFSNGGNDIVTVSGFSSESVKVFDITHPKDPVEITDTTIDFVGSTRVSFRTAGPEARYLAVVPETIRTPAAAGGVRESLTNGSHGADYVLIVPSALSTTTQELADYRAAQGLSVEIVSLEAIMDAFSDGVSNPKSIKDFLLYARDHWSPRPRFIVLVGKGTFDYQDNRNLATNLVPPKLLGTPDGLFASDNWLADLDGEQGIPEMAIGRLPVVDDAELTILIQKIKNYESATTGSWNQRIIMVADNTEQFANFSVNSDQVAGHIPSTPYQQEKVYLGVNVDLDQARQAVADGFNTGSLLINYVGHGGVDTLADEGIFTSNDVAGLSANDKLPILAALTCIVSRFEIPEAGYRALGEKLLLSSGGAIAVWAPTGLSANTEAETLNIAFMDALMGAAGGRLGDVIATALGALEQHASLASVYTLLGDPALRLPTP